MGVLGELALVSVLKTFTLAPLVMGFVAVFWITQRFDFTFAGYFVFGAYAPLLLRSFGLSMNWFNLIIVMVLFPALVSLILEATVYWQIYRSEQGRMKFLVASIGVYAIIENTMAILFGDKSVQTFPSLSSTVISFANCSASLGLLFGAGIGVISASVFLLVLKYSSLGLTARAVVADHQLARFHGINVMRIHGLVLGTGAALASIGGFSASLDSFAIPSAGMQPLILAVVVTLATPVLKVRRAWVLTIAFMGIESVVSFWLSSRFAPAITYGVFFVVAVLVGRREMAASYRGL